MPTDWSNFSAVEDEPEIKSKINWDDFSAVDDEPEKLIPPTFESQPLPVATPEQLQRSEQPFSFPPNEDSISKKPFVPLPRFTVKKDDSIPTAVAKQAANMAISIPEFFETPVGIGAAAGGIVAPVLTAGAFTYDLLKSYINQAKELGKNWDSMSGAERAAALVDMTGTGAFAGLTGTHAIRGAAKKVMPSEPIPTIEPPKQLPPIPEEPIIDVESTPVIERTPNAILEEAAKPVQSVQPLAVEGEGKVSPNAPSQEVSSGGEPTVTPQAEPTLLLKKGETDPNTGARFDGETIGDYLQFTAYDKSGAEGTTYIVKKGSTPDQMRAKYDEVRKRYLDAGDEAKAPRPLPETKEDLQQQLAESGEVTPPKEPVTPSPELFQDWRVQGNTLRHSGVGKKLTQQQAETIMAKMPDYGITGRYDPVKGVVVVNSGILSEASRMWESEGSYAKKSNQLAAEKQASKSARESVESKRKDEIKESTAANWIDDVFGSDAMNNFNKLELAKFLEGKTTKFGGAANSKWRDGLSKIGATSINEIKSSYEKSLTETPPPEGGGIGGGIQRAIERNREGGFVNMQPAIEFGTKVFEKAKDFAAWSVEMVKQFGEAIRDKLQEIYQKIGGNLKQADPQWRVTVQGEQIMPDGKTKVPGYVQIDDISGGENKWSKNPQTLRGEGFLIPEGIEGLPTGRYTMAELQQRLGRQERHAGIPIPIKETYEKLKRVRAAMSTRMAARPTRHIMDQTIDAADNKANIAGRQMGNRVRIGTTPIQDRAASAIVAADFNPSNLPDLLAKSVAGNHTEAADAVRYAMNNYNRVEPIAQRGKQVFDDQVARENASGINTQYAEAYLPGIYDMDLMMGSSRPFVIGGKGGGVGSSFKKGKSFATPFDAIEAGYKPKTLALSELVEHRVKSGQRLVNRVEWSDSLRGTVDPTDSKPIVTSLVKHTRGTGQPGWEAPPAGYERRTIIPGVDLAIHEGYSKLFDALTGNSKFGELEPGGVPVGTALLEGAGAIKHGMLLFDTFHASRIGQKQMFLNKKLKPSYKRGLSLLEYDNADLNRAVAAGEITPEMAAYATANRPRANLMLKSGLNVGRIQEALYTSLARKIPIIGTFNKWVFEKMTRGAMLESSLIEFDRVKVNNPTWSDEQVAQKVSRDLNAYFGNLGRQGVFKSATFQDAARLVALAPQWVESMARSELGGAKQLAIDPLVKRKLVVGSLGAGLAQGLLAYFVGTQLINLVTRKQLTFDNPEKDHKWDAWIPDVTGKSNGYFLSPMGVVTELTHDFMKYAHNGDNYVEAAARVLSNKASPYFRAGKAFFFGRDWKDNKITGAWNRVKEAGAALAPTPIIASSAIKEGKPGQEQRQVMASLGFKTDQAPTASESVFQMARNWMSDSKDPFVRSAFDKKQKMELGESDYKPLRMALQVKDKEKAVEAINDLLSKFPKDKEQERVKLMLRTFAPFTKGGGKPEDAYKIRAKPFATGSVELEKAFVASLDEDGKKAYRQAIQDKVQAYRLLHEVLLGKPTYPPLTPEAYQRPNP